MNSSAKSILVFLSFLVLLRFHSLCSSYPTPLNCTDTTRLCTSFLAFQPTSNQTLTLIQSMFDVLPNDVTVEGNDRDYIFIRKNCSCTSDKEYLTNTTYTVRVNAGSVHDLVVEAYDGLAFLPNFTREARAGSVVSLQLFCGCSSGLWNYLMSYVMRDGDSVASLASRFGVSMDSIERANGIENPDNVSVGSLFYIPLNSAPGEPYPIEDQSPSPSVPAPTPSVQSNAGRGSPHSTTSSYGNPFCRTYDHLNVICLMALRGYHENIFDGGKNEFLSAYKVFRAKRKLHT